MHSQIEPFDDDHWQKGKPWQIKLSRLFHRAWVEVLIGVLVLLSVVLTLTEFWLEYKFHEGLTVVDTAFGALTRYHLGLIMMVNDLVTLIFIIELTLRFLAARSKRKYFAEFWLDIIAVLPLFRVFRSARALRLLRLFRLLRLLGVIARLSGHFPSVFRRGAVDFLIICSMLLLTITFGTVAIMHFETSGANSNAANNAVAGGSLNSDTVSNLTNNSSEADNASTSPQFDLDQSFWFSVYTLFAGEPVPSSPQTLSGKIVAVFLMFMGMTIFAIFAGTVSAFMVDRIRVEGRVVEWDTLEDHIVICGWTPKTKIIINEYRASPNTRKTPIVVITEHAPDEFEGEAKGWTNVMFIHDDFTKVGALIRAGIRNAKTCLVLTDTTGGRSEQDADARTILAALTVEKINEEVYTCAELVNRSYATHLETGKVNDFVVSGEYGAHMLAQAAMNRGLINVLSELLTYERGNEFHRIKIPTKWIGQTFDQKLGDVQKSANAILLAVHSSDDEPNVNPENYTFREGDEVVLISKGRPKLS